MVSVKAIETGLHVESGASNQTRAALYKDTLQSSGGVHYLEYGMNASVARH